MDIKIRNHCQLNKDFDDTYKKEIPGIVENIIETCSDPKCFNHIGISQIPSTESIKEIIEMIRDVLFPGYFGQQSISIHELTYHVGMEINHIFERLSHQISSAFRHECRRIDKTCNECSLLGYNNTIELLKKFPNLRKILATDVRAAYDGDPASKSYDEIIFCYPGFYAILIYRIAHELYIQNVPLIPRIMGEYAHSITGIDIHPGAVIDENFFIDHGTGVVIGETCKIGKNVRIYQGVTLGALSFPKDEQGRIRKKLQRHPTIKDNAIIYSGATILGGDTIIGKNSIIGGNVWITKSVPSDTKVLMKNQDLIYKTKGKRKARNIMYYI